jgi:hypothetical protein
LKLEALIINTLKIFILFFSISYDQPLDQRRRPSTAGAGAGDEGGSTSGRGTMPPGGYGSSPASTGSSPVRKGNFNE